MTEVHEYNDGDVTTGQAGAGMKETASPCVLTDQFCGWMLCHRLSTVTWCDCRERLDLPHINTEV